MDNKLNVRDEYKELSVLEIEEIAYSKRLPYAVCLLNVDGGLNISTSIRSAHTFNVGKVFVFGRSKFDRRGMVGCQNYTMINKVPGLNGDELDLAKFKEFISMYQYEPIFVETGGEALKDVEWEHHLSITWPRTPLFVFGNEKDGIPEEFVKAYPKAMLVSIPMGGVQRSLNVSCAVSIVLYDFCNRLKWMNQT